MYRALLAPTGVAVFPGLFLAPKVFALSTETFGNRPMSELNYTLWKGIMPLVNDNARFYATWTNGNEHLYYKGTTKELNAALAHFAKVEVKNHVVVLAPGSGVQTTFDKKPVAYNWELHVLGGLARTRATDNAEDLYWQRDPVITIRVGGDVDLDKLEVPVGITLRAASGKGEEARQNAVVMRKIAEYLERRKK